MASSSQKDLAVVIVSWNVKDAVLDNLRSLFVSDPMPALDVVVVDNASHDGTVETVRRAFPQVRVIANEENFGFAKACNQGIAASHARHVLLLNPDMRVEPDALAKLVSYLDTHPKAGVVSGKLLDEKGKPMHHMRRFPTVWTQLLIVLKLAKFFPALLDRYHGKDLDLEKEQEVDTVRGSFFAMNRTALDLVGLLDERFYIWFEEVDYCKRVHLHNLRVMYVPSIVAHDLVGRSFKQRKLTWRQAQFLKSMAAYFEKWHPGWRVWLIQFAVPVGNALTRVFARYV
ncbi:MAG TPA: glycosyltransferase family 2 protein [Verrucomicrobiae bacterium]|nr:glycosyltransferase family 2 protein [Verrucomicrobiae bacterium]